MRLHLDVDLGLPKINRHSCKKLTVLKTLTYNTVKIMTTFDILFKKVHMG